MIPFIWDLCLTCYLRLSDSICTVSYDQVVQRRSDDRGGQLSKGSENKRDMDYFVLMWQRFMSNSLNFELPNDYLIVLAKFPILKSHENLQSTQLKAILYHVLYSDMYGAHANKAFDFRGSRQHFMCDSLVE